MPTHRLLAGLLSTCVAFAAGAAPAAKGQVRLPELGGSAQAMLSPSEANQYGASMLHQMRSMHMVLDDPLVNAYLNDVGYRLVAHSDNPSQKFTFFVVKTQDINAFAVPGGYIGVYAGLIDLTHSESELAAVMAHEIGHITQHHMERAFEASKKDAPLMALVLLGAIVAGAADKGSGHPYGYQGYSDSGGNAGLGVLAAGMGLLQQRQINFTRKDEIEADRTGIRTLAAAGYNPEAMASFFQRMQDTLGGGDSVPALLQTHPVTLLRIADAKARARMLESENKGTVVPPISLEQWKKTTAPLQFVSDPKELFPAAAAKGSHHLSLYKLMRERVRALSLDPSKAVDYYRSHMQHPGFTGVPANHYGYALALTRDHQADQALAQLRPLLDKYPSSLPLCLAQADALVHAGKTPQALKIYARLNAQSPQNRAIVQAYAQGLIHDKSKIRARQAADLLKPLLDDTDEPQLFRIYARASEIAGEKVDAAEAWANASYLAGRPFDAMQQLKRLLRRKDLNYYQRARIQADIDQLRPLLLELQKRHVKTRDRPNGSQRD